MQKKILTILFVVLAIFTLASCVSVNTTTQREEGTLTVVIDVPEEANTKTVHISVKQADKKLDKSVVAEFDLSFKFNWRRFDKFSGVGKVPYGTYLVVADFFDKSGTYLFSKEVGEITTPAQSVLEFKDEKIIDAPKLTLGTSGNSIYVIATPDREDAAIYYTTEKESVISDDVLHIKGKRYTGPVAIANTTTFRAVAVAKDMIVSKVAKETFSLVKTAAPVASHNSGAYANAIGVTLSQKDNAAIYYTTDGSTPTKSSTKYANEKIAVNKNTTLKAFAASNAKNALDSDVVTYNYEVKAKAPVSSLAEGTYKSRQTAKLSTETPNCEIYYTTDGTTPTTSSKRYSGAINIDNNKVLKAIAVGKNYAPSDVATFNYKMVNNAKVSAVPAPGTYSDAVSVKLSSNNGGDIFYTTDGSTPTKTSKKYVAPVTVDNNTVIKAIVCNDKYVESEVAPFDYKFKVATPVSSVANNTSISSMKPVTLKTATNGATIKYSLDGGKATVYDASKGISVTSAGRHTLTAQAYKNNWVDSDVMTVAFDVVNALNAPEISLPSGTYREPKITTITLSGIAKELNADIYYTTNDAIADKDIATKGTKYQANTSLKIDKNCILRAVAVKSGYNTSPVAKAEYDLIVKEVAFTSVPVKDKTGVFKVEISCDTEGATIYYTTNGTEPTTASGKYAGAFEVAYGTEVQAFATKAGWQSSGVISWQRKK